jgi:hypothetical protein
MISKSLIRNLIENGLQPVIAKNGKREDGGSLKLNDYSKFYDDWKEEQAAKGLPTSLGDIKELVDVEKFFNCKPENYVGVMLKNTSIREANNGYVILDFDLKGNDTMAVFDDIVKDLKQNKLWKQVEVKRNGNGYHIVLLMKQHEIAQCVARIKISRGAKSFLEIFTAGRTLFRLCPNPDYIIEGTLPEQNAHINFSIMDYLPLSLVKSWSKSNKDEITPKSTFEEIEDINNKYIDFSFVDAELETEEERLLYAYIKSNKMDYEEAKKMAIGLGVRKYDKLFSKAIPPQKINEYKKLFKKGYFSKFKTTKYIENILSSLKLKKDVIEFSKYLPFDEVEKILTSESKKTLIIAPTGSGKTFTLITVAKKLNLKMIFTVPNVAVVMQVAKEFKIGSAYGTKSLKKELEKNNIVVCTIDKLSHIQNECYLSEFILVLDEKHTHITTVNFRSTAVFEASSIREKFKKIVDVTATPEPLNLKDYDEQKVFYTPDTKRYAINITVTKTGKAVLVNKLRESKSDINVILNNDITFNDNAKYRFKPSESINAGTKKNEVYEHILEKQEIPKHIKYLFTTDMFSAGLNLNNTGDITIFINGFADATLIKQFVARFRKVENIKVEIIIPPREFKPKSKEVLIDKSFAYAEKKLNEFKEAMDTEKMLLIKKQGIVFDRYFAFDEKTEKIHIFPETIYNSAWKTVMNYCKPTDLLTCFEKGTYTCNIETIDLNKDYGFNDDVKFEKDAKKEIRRAKKENTISEIEDLDLTITAFKGLENYCEATIEKYDELRTKRRISKELALRIISDDDFLEKAIFRYNQISKDKKGIIETETRKISLYVYKKLAEGKVIKVKEICIRNKFNEAIFKKALIYFWEVKEVRTGKGRLKEILQRAEPLQLSRNESEELIKSGLIINEVIV